MPVKHTHIGGQAVLEGVMMRGKHNWAVAVRKSDGTIHLEAHELKRKADTTPWLGWPVIRGVWALYETMALAFKAFGISAQYADIGGEAPAQRSPAETGRPSTEGAEPGAAVEAEGGEPAEPAAEPAGATLSAKEIAFTMVLGIGLAILIFVILPAVATNLLGEWVRKTTFAWNLIDGVLRLVVFFLYIALISRMRDIQRVFGYHGAEHEIIHAYEHGDPLDAAHARKYGTLHVRCGTSFLLMVMVIAIIVFSLVPTHDLLGRILVRIVLLPVVAGLAYEVSVKWAGSRPENPLVKVLLWPGLQLQRMTTRPPSDDMIEIAAAAMNAVIEREQAAALAEDRGARPVEPAID